MPFMRLEIRTRWISDREYDMLLRSCHHFILLYELRHDIAEILLIKIKLALNTNQSINLYELFILPLFLVFSTFFVSSPGCLITEYTFLKRKRSATQQLNLNCDVQHEKQYYNGMGRYIS